MLEVIIIIIIIFTILLTHHRTHWYVNYPYTAHLNGYFGLSHLTDPVPALYPAIKIIKCHKFDTLLFAELILTYFN